MGDRVVVRAHAGYGVGSGEDGSKGSVLVAETIQRMPTYSSCSPKLEPRHTIGHGGCFSLSLPLMLTDCWFFMVHA